MKRKIIILLCIVFVFLVAGCEAKDNGEDTIYVYHLNVDGNTIIQDAYPKKGIKNTIEKINEAAAFLKHATIENTQLKNSCLNLYFGESYYELEKSKEVLFRAATVQTLTQYEEVGFVQFYVGDHPLMDSDGNEVGMMRAEDFVQNTGLSIDAYQTTDLTLFFSTKDGKQLKETKKTSVRYNVNTAIERLVVEQLMKGTNATGCQPTIPKTAMLLGVSVKDEICYVNFDSKFTTDSYDLDPEVTIYSIVNSIIANSSVEKVQILIDGASDVVYKSKVDLARPLEQKLDFVEE